MTSRPRRFAVLATTCFAVILAIVCCFFWLRKHVSDEASASLKIDDYIHAVSNLRIAAYMGDANAQAMLGDMYALGWGVTKNDDEAISWYTRAGVDREYAKNPAAPAMYYIGRKYLGGEAVPRNDAEARKWFQRSAQGGYAKATEALAQMSAKEP